MATEVRDTFDSYTRCCTKEEFFTIFYEDFLKKSPEIAPMFAHTDWRQQRKLIKVALKSMILYARDPSEGKVREHMLSIGKSHSRKGLNVKPELYPLWVDSMLFAIGECDPNYTERLRRDWLKVLNPAIELIISQYDT